MSNATLAPAGGGAARSAPFTASASFANPAVTAARMLTDSFTGIAPASAPGFIVAQLAGVAAGAGLVGLLWPARERR